MPDNLWGDLPAVDELLHPKTILAEQATVLAERTNGILHGKIAAHQGLVTDAKEIVKFGDSCLTFDIVCPSLQNYRFEVLRVFYTLTDVYPAKVINTSREAPEVTVANPEEFKEAIRQIFQSQRVRKAIAALLHEAEA